MPSSPRQGPTPKSNPRTLAVAHVFLTVMSASLRGNRRSPERNYHASAQNHRSDED